MKTHLLFDLDGTLTDPGVGITNSVAYALRKRGIPVESRESLYPFIGPPLQESFELYYHFSPAEAARAVEDYREYFHDRGIFENILYGGVPELLQALRADGRCCILASSKPTVFVRRILEHFEIAAPFSIVVGSNLDGSRTKKGEVIREALHAAGDPDPKTALMIGDRRHDVCGAREAGIEAVGVLYGYGGKRELAEAGADYLAASVPELQALLLSL